MSRVRLLTSKVLFLTVAIILPSLLVEVGLLFVCGVIPHDILRSVPQILILALLAGAVLMMLAAVTTSLARMILAGGHYSGWGPGPLRPMEPRLRRPFLPPATAPFLSVLRWSCLGPPGRWLDISI